MKQIISTILLEKQAVMLNVKEPFTFVSGIRSPIYCDNRLLTFYPEERATIIDDFVRKVREHDPDVIAGTASSAISWAAWVAERLGKPLVYIRKKSKDYGQQKLIEGGDIRGKTVVVIEDLVSTGGSSFNAVTSCREAGAEVISMVAIFTYEFEKASRLFHEGRCKAEFLTDFSTLVEVAAENQFLEKEQIEMVKEWSKDPAGWGPKHGFQLGEQNN